MRMMCAPCRANKFFKPPGVSGPGWSRSSASATEVSRNILRRLFVFKSAYIRTTIFSSHLLMVSGTGVVFSGPHGWSSIVGPPCVIFPFVRKRCDMCAHTSVSVLLSHIDSRTIVSTDPSDTRTYNQSCYFPSCYFRGQGYCRLLSFKISQYRSANAASLMRAFARVLLLLGLEVVRFWCWQSLEDHVAFFLSSTGTRPHASHGSVRVWRMWRCVCERGWNVAHRFEGCVCA